MMRLTKREETIISAAASGPITQIGKTYYRLGGFGNIDVRFSYMTLHNLHKRGLLVADGAIYRASVMGLSALSESKVQTTQPGDGK